MIPIKHSEWLPEIEGEFPYLLLDRIIELQEDQSILALKNVSGSEQFFLGHFPDFAIMPGVLIIDALIQAGMVLINRSGSRKRISRVERFRFKKGVRPGDRLMLRVEIKQKQDDAVIVDAVASVENEIVAKGKLCFQ